MRDVLESSPEHGSGDVLHVLLTEFVRVCSLAPERWHEECENRQNLESAKYHERRQ